MKLSRHHLIEAEKKGLLTEHQAEQLWQFLSERTKDNPRLCLAHVLYYVGGLIAISAMSLFMTLGWERFGGIGVFLIALAYGGVGLWLTEFFLTKYHLAIPAGITATFVVILTPLAVYGVQAELGWWVVGEVPQNYHAQIDGRLMVMALATLISGGLMLRHYRLPFLVMPIALTLWYMCLEVTPFLLGATESNWALSQEVSLGVGLGMTLLAVWIDSRAYPEKDYAFWFYLMGVITFWCSVSLMNLESEVNQFIYLCINSLMICVGSFLARRVFIIFGGLGAAGYLAHLAYDVFKDSLLFPFVLVLIGIAIIGLSVIWQRHARR